MELSIAVIDNFLPKPELVRHQALNLDFFIEGSFPGKRSLATDYEYREFIKLKIENNLRINIVEWVMDSFCFQLCLKGSKSWIHADKCDWAGVLYLTPNAPVESGTNFFNEKNDIVDSIGNKFNRAIFYKADQLHSSNLSGFGESADTGRLTQVFFFNVK